MANTFFSQRFPLSDVRTGQPPTPQYQHLPLGALTLALTPGGSINVEWMGEYQVKMHTPWGLMLGVGDVLMAVGIGGVLRACGLRRSGAGSNVPQSQPSSAVGGANAA